MSCLRRFFYKRFGYSGNLDLENVSLLIDATSQVKSTRKWSDTDGPLAWLIALAIFSVNFVVLGQGRVAGILYVDFMEVFQVNRKMASAPYSVQQSTRMLFGPVVGILGQRFGVSFVTILGCVVTALSSAACFFAHDFYWIILMWGGIYGLGTAFTSTINVIVIEQYFTKHRSSATGFAFSGTCIGAMFFPALVQILVHKYEIRGAFLIMGSIILNVIPIAMLVGEKRTADSETETEIEKKRYRSEPNYKSFSDNEEFFDNTHKDDGNTDKSELSKVNGMLIVKISPESSTAEYLGTGTCFDFVNNSNDAKDKNILEENVSGSPKDQITSNKSHLKQRQLSGKKHVNDSLSKLSETQLNEASVKIENIHHISEESKDLAVSLVIDSFDGDEEECQSMSKSSLSPKYKTRPCVASTSKALTSDESIMPQNKAKSFRRQNDPLICQYWTFKDCSADAVKNRASVTVKAPNNFKNAINFKELHENSDLVLELLSNKIPIGEDEIVLSDNEITQNDLESPDAEFISHELQRIEYHFQKPFVEAQLFLIEFKNKLREFKHILNSHRSGISQEKRQGSKGYNYKDIRTVTIEKSCYTIEITEYSFEIPVDLYIPIKLEELFERSSSYIESYYSNNKKISIILRQLRKLHELLNDSPESKTNVLSEYTSFSYKHSADNINSDGTKESIKNYSGAFYSDILTAFKLHVNPMFLLVCLSRALTAITFVPVITSVVDFAMDKGMVKSDGKYIIAALSTGDLIGRLCTGWITDKGYISNANFMVVGLFLQAVFTCLLPQMKGAAMLFPAITAFAVLQGTLFVKHPVVLLQYLREHEKYIGLGFINFFSGLAGFIIPYYIGYVRDYLKSYDMLYYINGGLSAVVGFLWLLEPCLTMFVPAIRK